MLESATQTAPIVGLEFDEPERITATPKELAVQCVVFVGNLLTTRQMKSPSYRLGGKLFPWPDFYTVPNGIVPRCFITRLQKNYRSIPKSAVQKEQWPMWVESYTLKNHWDTATQTFHDVEVGGSGPGLDLLYKPISPIHEIGRIAGKNEGVVALDEDCGIASGEDIKAAQFHYFPQGSKLDWLKLLMQEQSFPVLLRDLEDHIRNRREQTNSANMRAIGDAYLMSCSDYREAAKRDRIDVQTAAIKETEKFAGGARYDEVVERMFKELELTRQDQLHEGLARSQNEQASQSADIATAITLMSQIIAKQNQAEATLPPAEQQPPAPVTVEQAHAEVERAVEESTFTDMSEAVIEPTEDELAAKYMHNAGAETVEATEPEDDQAV